MNLVLRSVAFDEKDRLARLLDAHLTEHNAYQDPRVGPETAAEYVYFLDYWREEGRYPYYIVAHAEVVGFVLVRTVQQREKVFYQVSEFYVCPEHRRKGYGKLAVQTLWAKLSGEWELQVLALNERAYAFWAHCVQAQSVLNLKITETSEADGARYQFNFLVQ